jgi:hypothetical protein
MKSKWNIVEARWSLDRKLAILSASMVEAIYAVTGTRDIAVVPVVFSFFGVISGRWRDYVIQAKREDPVPRGFPENLENKQHGVGLKNRSSVCAKISNLRVINKTCNPHPHRLVFLGAVATEAIGKMECLKDNAQQRQPSPTASHA